VLALKVSALVLLAIIIVAIITIEREILL